MTSPWQHIPSMRIYITKWRIRHTQLSMRRTHLLLRNCRNYAKLACHCTACYKMEWIYMRTKVSGPNSLELALEMRKKERRKKEWEMATFLNIWFWHIQLMWLMILVDNLLEILIFTLKNFTKLPILRYLGICNVLYISHIGAIPTYRVYRLYDN